uniref:Uncharacterized protein n=1 Tax=Vitis vinifera TaxID=29760 RepID=F6GZR1_VITVI
MGKGSGGKFNRS